MNTPPNDPKNDGITDDHTDDHENDDHHDVVKIQGAEGVGEIGEGEGAISRAPMDSSPVWLNRGTFLAKYIGHPIHHYFTKVEAASGIVLIAAAVIAVIWVNLGGDSYEHFWETHIDIGVGGVEIFKGSLEHFVNDVLMVLFFLVVGVEIKTEIVSGHLQKFRDAALPVIAAIGGMAVPAFVFFIFNRGTDASSGWAIPTATDIAFALGVVSLLGKRIPTNLRVFLLTLSVADDLLAILIIAIFYTSDLEFRWLVGAVVVAVLIGLSRRARIWYTPFYFLLGALLWWMTYRSGVHATIAGVTIGFLTPARPIKERHESQAVAYWLQKKEHVYVADVRWANFQLTESVSVAERIQAHLHPITSFIIVPIFALANSGIALSTDIFGDALLNRVTGGVFFGLLIGKVVGVTLFTWIGTKLKVASLPAGLNWLSVVGVGMIAGIGFTVAIFVSSLSFEGGGNSLTDSLGQAKFGIFAASAVAAIVGSMILNSVYGKNKTI